MTTTTLHPRVYVGTYAKYNSGSLEGAWIDLDYHTKETFYEAIKELHKDEKDPEFMYQDWENDPCNYISESSIKDEVWDFIEMTEGWDADRIEAYHAFIAYTGNESIDDFEEAYQGKYDSDVDFAVSLVNECYDLNKMMGSLHYYFDYEAYARDLFSCDYWSEDGHIFRSI